MTKAKTLIALALVLLGAGFAFFHYKNAFSRLKQVEITTAPIEPGTLGKIVLQNNSSSKLEFPLRCYHKVGPDGRVLFTKVVVLPPRGSVEFDVNPEHAGRELPRMIANKACEATWRGPFGMERSAWWVSWQYGKDARKIIYAPLPPPR